MQFVVGAGEREAFVQVLFADPAGDVRHGGDRCECPAGEPPAHESGEQGDQCQPDPGPEQQLLENRVPHHADGAVGQPEADGVGRQSQRGRTRRRNSRRGHRNAGTHVFRGRPAADGCDHFYAPDLLRRPVPGQDHDEGEQCHAGDQEQSGEGRGQAGPEGHLAQSAQPHRR
ncbi:hypothetical protein [Streptomyces canus]|uniref:hypothetical protein n=1 Tax=Streptomyces canus TaxID=58343 RepID=UPI003F6BC45B